MAYMLAIAPSRHADLAVDVLDVVGNGLRGNEQGGANVLVGSSCAARRRTSTSRTVSPADPCRRRGTGCPATARTPRTASASRRPPAHVRPELVRCLNGRPGAPDEGEARAWTDRRRRPPGPEQAEISRYRKARGGSPSRLNVRGRGRQLTRARPGRAIGGASARSIMGTCGRARTPPRPGGGSCPRWRWTRQPAEPLDQGCPAQGGHLQAGHAGLSSGGSGQV